MAPLDVASTRDLVQEVFGEPAAQELAEAIHQRTRGNPFFVEETVKALVEEMTLGGERTPTVQDLLDLKLPRTIRDVVIARLGQLSSRGSATRGSRRRDWNALVARRARVRESVARGCAPHRARRASHRSRHRRAYRERRHRLRLHASAAAGNAVRGARPRAHAHAARGRSPSRSRHFTAPAPRRTSTSSRSTTCGPTLVVSPKRRCSTSMRRAWTRWRSTPIARPRIISLPRWSSSSEWGSWNDERSIAVAHDLARARQRLGDYPAALALWRRAADGCREARLAFQAGDDSPQHGDGVVSGAGVTTRRCRITTRAIAAAVARASRRSRRAR